MKSRKKLREGSAPLDMLAPDPKNPRSMSDDARAGLSASMEDFGDLSGIVFNDRTKQLVAGHQRVDDLRKAGATEFQRQGDRGYIAHPKTGERFPIRFVDWDAVKQRKANLVANNPYVAGEFTDELLGQLEALKLDVDFGTLQGESLLQKLQVDFQAMNGGQIDDNLFGSFSGEIGKSSKTFAVTLNVPKKHQGLFEDLPKEEAIDLLVKWLKGRRKAWSPFRPSCERWLANDTSQLTRGELFYGEASFLLPCPPEHVR